jgi:DNA-directed RNA polymerase specialized sigma24 family protein
MFGARQTLSQQSSAYASAADFYQLFMKDMNRLYTLSLLLTADHSLAEECLVRGLDDSSSSTRIFKEWLQSWATRTIIQSAIQIIRPRPGDGRTPDRKAAMNQPAELAAVIELPPFERFVFVLSVLERYSDQECSLLLNTNRGEVTAARTHALQSIGNSAELRYQRLGTDLCGRLAVSA